MADMCYNGAMNDDDIIRHRIDGHSVRAIAKAQHTTASKMNETIDRWTDSTVNDKIRKHSFVLAMSFRAVSHRRAQCRALVT
jgi:hypothetical protein